MQRFRGVLFIAILFAAGTTALAGWTTLTCSGKSVCRYSIFYAKGGQRAVTVKPGQKVDVDGVTAGDTFCMSTSGTPNSRTCREPRSACEARSSSDGGGTCPLADAHGRAAGIVAP